MIAIEPVTLTEAEFLTGRPEKEINRAIDRREVDKIVEKVRVPATKKRPGRRPKARGGKTRATRQQRVFHAAAPAMATRTVRKLGVPELLFFALEREVHKDLSPSGRKKLYQAIKAQPTNARVVSLGPFEASVAKAAKALAARFKELKALRSEVVEQQGQDPVIKGTDISVYRVAALAQGQTIPEVLDDYPTLTEQQVQRAIDYAIAYPKPGRPYPARSFRRTAEALADMGAFGPSAQPAET